jgi:hypothetical protein
MIRFKVVEILTEGDVSIDIKTIPKCKGDIVILEFGRSNRFGEAEERQSEIDKAVLVILNLFALVNDL